MFLTMEDSASNIAVVENAYMGKKTAWLPWHLYLSVTEEKSVSSPAPSVRDSMWVKQKGNCSITWPSICETHV